jgi:hypothetical protein
MRGPSTATIEVGPLSLRAELGSVDAEARTAELIFSTGAAVERFDWETGKRFLEKLAITPKAIRLERLNAGGPLLDSHSSESITDQIGAVIPGTARIERGMALATVRFSARESVAPIFQDVKDGILRHVSVGYRTYQYEEEPASKKSVIPTRTAVDWEPYEISMVSMPADAGARVRRDDVKTNQCVLVTRQQETAMDEDQVTGGAGDEQQSEFIREDVQPQQTRTAVEPETHEPNERDMGASAERDRVNGILDATKAARLPFSFARKLIDEKLPLLDAQKRVFKELAGREDPPASQNTPSGLARGSMTVEFGDSPLIHARAGIENALLHRVASTHFKLTDQGREYRGMTMLDVAKSYLVARGVRITGMNKMELAAAALGLTAVRTGGMHTTSDFPLLLQDVATKTLRAEYEAAAQTFLPIVRRISLNDFRASNRVQIGDAPALMPVNEHGEFTRGTIVEGREQIQLATYGRVFAITRKALINDDTDAFSRVPAKFGRAARNLESDIVWYQILSNPTMGDSVTLFHASHRNYAGAGMIGINTVGAGETAMMLQTGLDGTTLVMGTPRFLIVPPSQRIKALQFVAVVNASQIDNVNPYAGKLEVITEPRLETGVTIGTTTATGSSTAWYLVADPAQVDVIELATLDGQEGPMVESRVGFDVDGLEIKCRHDVGAKVIDHRGLYKNDGSVDS